MSFAGQTVTATADTNGKWVAKLSPMKASTESCTLTVSGGSRLEIQDVPVGDVWVCSGQSNMELSAGAPPAPPGTPPPARPLNTGLPDSTREQEVAAANHPEIRFNKISSVMSLQPASEAMGRWVLSTPETMRSFSTAAYFFGRELNQKLGVPIGLIGAYYGDLPSLMTGRGLSRRYANVESDRFPRSDLAREAGWNERSDETWDARTPGGFLRSASWMRRQVLGFIQSIGT